MSTNHTTAGHRVSKRRGSGRGPMVQVKVLLFAADDLAPHVAACMDKAAILEAGRFAQSCAFDRLENMPSCVYVIGPTEIDGINKVGISNNPISRLCSLQIGNWNRLGIKALIWTNDGPGELENLAHQAALEMGVSINGEWVALDDEAATELVLKAARYSRTHVADSGLHMENMVTRARALRGLRNSDAVAA
jgi:hypothetical protein